MLKYIYLDPAGRAVYQNGGFKLMVTMQILQCLALSHLGATTNPGGSLTVMYGTVDIQTSNWMSLH